MPLRLLELGRPALADPVSAPSRRLQNLARLRADVESHRLKAARAVADVKAVAHLLAAADVKIASCLLKTEKAARAVAAERVASRRLKAAVASRPQAARAAADVKVVSRRLKAVKAVAAEKDARAVKTAKVGESPRKRVVAAEAVRSVEATRTPQS